MTRLARAQHNEAVDRYTAEHGRSARRRKAAEREADTVRIMREQNVSRGEAQRAGKASRHLKDAVAAAVTP